MLFYKSENVMNIYRATWKLHRLPIFHSQLSYSSQRESSSSLIIQLLINLRLYHIIKNMKSNQGSEALCIVYKYLHVKQKGSDPYVVKTKNSSFIDFLSRFTEKIYNKFKWRHLKPSEHRKNHQSVSQLVSLACERDDTEVELKSIRRMMKYEWSEWLRCVNM